MGDLLLFLVPATIALCSGCFGVLDCGGRIGQPQRKAMVVMFAVMLPPFVCRLIGFWVGGCVCVSLSIYIFRLYISLRARLRVRAQS